jgi:hypothetical protein
MRGAQELPHCPVTIEENDIINGAAEILKFIRPQWEKDQISYKVNYIFPSKIKNNSVFLNSTIAKKVNIAFILHLKLSVLGRT